MYSAIKPWKAFVRHFAWVVVAALPDLTVGVRTQFLMEEYQKCVLLFVSGRLQYTGDRFPPPPAVSAVMNLNSDAVLKLFLQSTAKVGSSTNGIALYRQVQADVKLVLLFMSDWCNLCPCASRLPTDFFPAPVPEGSCRDRVFAQIISSRESYRDNELNSCFKYVCFIDLMNIVAF